ncbi:SagB/ThcOx family dehydrogenase [Saccharothrix sp. DSM 118769]
MCYWHGGSFVVHPYPGGTPVALHPVAAEVLSAFDDWTEPAKAAELLGHLSRDTVDEAVEGMSRTGLLLAEDSPGAALDDRVARVWEHWMPEASFFHYGTLLSEDDPEEEQEVRGADEPLPAMFTGYPDAERVLLPRRPGDLRAPFDQVLYGRRTHRDFTGDPVPRDVLATLLSTVFGPVDFIDCGRGALFRRTSPSGGSRQEIDAYVGALNVEGVDPGLYHYNAREHSLELRSPGFSPQEAAHLCTDQDWVAGAAFLVVLVAVVERMSYKYHHPRCYRVSLLDAGHLGQTFALTATALGLGPAQTGAFHDVEVAERCGVDGTGSVPLYVLAAGWPAAETRYAPPPATMATFGHPTTLAVPSTGSVQLGRRGAQDGVGDAGQGR